MVATLIILFSLLSSRYISLVPLNGNHLILKKHSYLDMVLWLHRSINQGSRVLKQLKGVKS